MQVFSSFSGFSKLFPKVSQKFFQVLRKVLRKVFAKVFISDIALEAAQPPKAAP